MERLIAIIDKINRRVGLSVSWLSFCLVVLVVCDVLMRYLFRKSFVVVQELEWHLFAVFFLLGGGYTLLRDSHVRVDVFYQRLSPKVKAWVDILGVIFFLLPGCYLVIATSSKFAWLSWAVREGSPDPGGLPARYILKAIVVVAFFLLAVQGISMGLKNLLILLGRPGNQRGPVEGNQ